MERWIQSGRELRSTALDLNQRHPLHAPHEYERHFNTHRPHRGIANVRPLHPLPDPIAVARPVLPLTPPHQDQPTTDITQTASQGTASNTDGEEIIGDDGDGAIGGNDYQHIGDS
jgi:hypothetical protein